MINAKKLLSSRSHNFPLDQNGYLSKVPRYEVQYFSVLKKEIYMFVLWHFSMNKCWWLKQKNQNVFFVALLCMYHKLMYFMFQNNQNDLWMISIQLLFDCELDMAMKTALLFTTLYILYISIKINAFNVDTRRFPELFVRSLGRFQRSMEKPGIDTVSLRFRNGWENFNTFLSFFFRLP